MRFLADHHVLLLSPCVVRCVFCAAGRYAQGSDCEGLCEPSEDSRGLSADDPGPSVDDPFVYPSARTCARIVTLHTLRFVRFRKILCEFFIMAVVIFMTHACLGWGTLTLAPSVGIPKELQCCVKFYGYLIFWVVGLTYIPFLVFVTLTQCVNIECLIWKVQRLDHDRRKV